MPSPLDGDLHVDAQLGADGRVEIPLAVRRALKLQAHDRLRFEVTAEGAVTVHRIGPGRPPAKASISSDGLPQALGLLSGMLAGRASPTDERLSKVDPSLLNDLRDIVGSAFNPTTDEQKGPPKD